MVGTRRLIELVEGARSRTLLPDGEVTVALSGGADSAALAHLCVSSGAPTRAVHVHHGYPSSDTLTVAAENIAISLGIDLSTVEVEVSSGPSPEEMAHDARYRVLLAVEGAVLTAHTRDDNVETVLINLIPGKRAGRSGRNPTPSPSQRSPTPSRRHPQRNP